LADPVKNYPSMFKKSVLFAKYPYLLPNLICTIVVVLGLIVGFLFLEETHQDKRNREDVGLQLGRRLLRSISCLGCTMPDSQGEIDHVYNAVDEKGYYQPIPTSPQMAPTTERTEPVSSSPAEPIPEPRVSFWMSLTKQIKLIIMSYGLLAL
jgi:hypothetical protein